MGHPGHIGRLPGARATGPPDASSQAFAWPLSLVVLALAFALYANALGGSFQFDDTTSILENDALRSSDPLDWWAFWPGRLVSYTSLALDWHRFGLDPRGYHVTNLVVHALAGMAVLWLVTGLAQLAAPRRDARALGFAAAAVFVAHPLQTQAVAYITQRMASLYTLFYVTAVAAHVHGLRRSPPGWLRAVGLASGLLAVLSKEAALTLPAAIVLVDLAAAPTARGRWRRVAPYLPLALVPLVAAALGGGRFGADEATLTAQTTHVSRATYLFTQWEVLGRYLRLLVLPVGQNIDHDAPWRHSPLLPAVALSLLLHVSLLAAAAWRWRRGERLLPVAIFWWYLVLLPESSVFPIADAMVEHRLYAAMPGFALAVALPLEWLWQRQRLAAAVALLAVVAALGTATVARNRVWHDPYALWRDALAKSPQKGRPYAALGWLHNKAGRYAMAVEKLEQAVALDPNDPQAWNNLGLACQGLGDLARAAQAFQQATRVRPHAPVLWLNLAIAQEALGQLDAARRSLRECLARDPQNTPARERLEAIEHRTPAPETPAPPASPGR